MLDLARLFLLLVALALAIRHRSAIGVLWGLVLLCGYFAVAAAAVVALRHGAIGGEYGFAFVYVGPTMVPYGDRGWLPVAVQCAFALVAAVPAMRLLRTPSAPVTTPFLLVFMPNALLAVLTALGAFLMWHQQSAFPEYWQSP
jgi:hypothetical protein